MPELELDLSREVNVQMTIEEFDKAQAGEIVVVGGGGDRVPVNVFQCGLVAVRGQIGGAVAVAVMNEPSYEARNYHPADSADAIIKSRARHPLRDALILQGATDEPERWFVYVCPYCGRQSRGPGGHHVGGDDCACSCFHAHPGERGVTQPRLVKVRVVPAEPWRPRPVPHDRPPVAEPIGAEDPR